MAMSNSEFLHEVNHTSRHRRRAGFTWLELIVVICILGGLIALLLPATRRAPEAARRSACKNNLKQIGLALHNYHDMYGSFPPPYTVDADGQPLHSWRTLLLPLLDQQELYDQIDLSKPWDDPTNAEASAVVNPIYSCPSATLPEHHTTYMALVVPGSFFDRDEPRVLSDSSEENSNTVVVIEVAPEYAVHWMKPFDADEQSGMGFGEETVFTHSGGAHGLFVDGRVAFLKDDLTAEERGKLMRYQESGATAER